MSSQITTAFVKQYKNNIDFLCQQKGSKLRGNVRVETITGTDGFIEQIGKAPAAATGLSRHADTPLMNTPHLRRKISLTSYDWADLIDRHDKVRMLIEPQNAYAKSAAWMMGRAQDTALITAALGNAYTGSTGTSAVGLPDTQSVSLSAGHTGATGMNITKLRNAKYILDANDVDEMDRILVLHPYQLDELLGTTQVTSSDYNTVKALVRGEIDSFLGFKFVMTTLVAKSGSNRNCFAYHKDALALGIGEDTYASIDPRPDKRNSIQVYYAMDIGAARLEEEAVVKIPCLES
jgi:hypothetical protein